MNIQNKEQSELGAILNELMDYSYAYGKGNIPTSENPPIIIARQAQRTIKALITQARLEELANALEEHSPFGEEQRDISVEYAKWRIAALQAQLAKETTS